MGIKIKKNVRDLIFYCFRKIIPELKFLRDKEIEWSYFESKMTDTQISEFTKIYSPYKIHKSEINEGTYIAPNSSVTYTKIGKFCSIGPNFFCGWGIHPTNGISTSPMFYSTVKQNGKTYVSSDKIDERKKIVIGNDVFIGANVTVLDGVEIGDGAIIGAGAVVSKSIPAYSIAVGCPIKVLEYRFSEQQIAKLLEIKWWDFKEEYLKDIEKYFFDVENFIEKYSHK